MVYDFCLVGCFLTDGEDPMKVLLVLSTLWVQVHELPLGLFSESIAKQLGDFIGKFLEYDSKSLSRGLRHNVLVQRGSSRLFWYCLDSKPRALLKKQTQKQSRKMKLASEEQ
ncbi:hypothetical protein Gorai_002489, partial [Gossypium raimondii]|nr:hypothetical protein [Gossypium raimondii]